MNFKSLIVLVAISIAVYSCNTNNKTNNTEIKEEIVQTIQEIDAVCIWDEASIRSIPSSNGKYLTKMALGEKITWLGISEEDSTQEKPIVYHKVKLSDETEGWTSEYVIVTDAKPGVIINKAIVYTRPDLINATDKKLEIMDFVAIVKTENNWCEIVGEKNKIKGWVEMSSISLKKEDVAVALLAGKAFSENDEKVKKEKIEAIVNNPAFSNAIFLDKLKSEIEEQEVEVEEIELEETVNQDSLGE